MGVSHKEVQLTTGQQRSLKLLFKFRFVSAQSLALAIGIRRVSAYEVLENLVSKGLVTKVYKNHYRIRGKPAYYYLSKTGVTAVRKLLGVTESVVHALYKNEAATDDFIDHCLTLTELYACIKQSLPEGVDIFTKTEINRFTQFPKNRPDLYIRTPDGHEAMVVLAHDTPPYIIRKRLDEIITHSDEEGWEGDYPRMCFILTDERTKMSFLYATRKKLESMDIDDGELCVLATSLGAVKEEYGAIWSPAFIPTKHVSLFE